MTESDSRPASAVSVESVFDLTAALARVRGDAEFLKELIGLFQEESAELMRDLRQALDRQDATQVQRMAHSLKGAAGNFAAPSVTDAAFALEMIGMRGSLIDAEAAWNDLATSLGRLHVDLTRYVEDDAADAR